MKTTATPQLLDLPFFGAQVSAGFASPADDYIESLKNIQDLIVKRPAATFFAQTYGDSMREEIKAKDIIAVDRSLDPLNGDVVMVNIGGQYVVKRYVKRGQHAFLVPDNPAYPEIEIVAERDFLKFGVVRGFVRILCTR